MQDEQILKLVSLEIRQCLGRKDVERGNLQEIRIRCGRPLEIRENGNLYYLSKEYGKTQEEELAYMVREEDVKETLEFSSKYSLYAYEQERKCGYMTVEGGHRLGIVGHVWMENGKISNITYVGGVNLRLAKKEIELKPALMNCLIKNGEFENTLVLSMPGAGKTTLLRSIIAQLSTGGGRRTVGVVDERSEIAACYRGVPNKEIGNSVDVLDGCLKPEGMEMLLRSMSPDVIAVDELGNERDVQAVRELVRCGCGILATMHGGSMEDFQRNRVGKILWEEGVFGRYILLENKKNPGRIKGIYDELGRRIEYENYRVSFDYDGMFTSGIWKG